MINDGYFDGSHIITLAIYPVTYYPALSYIELNSTVEFEIKFKSNNRIQKTVKNRSEKNQEIYDMILKDLVDNPEDISIYQERPIVGKIIQTKTDPISFYDYVIITSDALKPYFETFISWKTRKGLDIGVVTTSEIYSNYPGGDQITGRGIADNSGSIRQYLSDAYYSGTVWVLIGGDDDIVPVRKGNTYIYGQPGYDEVNSTSYWLNPATDLYYADYDGDWNIDTITPIVYGEMDRGTDDDDAPDYYPEVWIGRLPCNCEQDISNWTEKILVYEQNPGRGDTSYLTNSFWIEGAEISSNLNTTKTYYPSSIYHTLWLKSTYHDGSEVVAKMDDDYGILNWYCHGSPNSFRTRPDADTHKRVFTYDSYCTYDSCSDESGDGLDAMVNNDKYSIVYSICCSVGAYDYTIGNCPGRSMVEGFTLMYEQNCGPAILANTRAGWMGSSEYLHRSWCSLIKKGTIYSDSTAYLHLGIAEAISKARNHSGGYYHFLNYSHNLFGCPETRIWTQIPSTFSSVSITDNVTSIYVNAGESGCDICASSGNDGAGYHWIESDASSYTFNTDVRPLYITVTKHNYIPYTAVTGGTFTTDETWFGNLHILGAVNFTGSGSLTILPGAHVLMDDYYSIRFYDSTQLTAEGTEADSILFTSTTGTSAQSWNRIYLRGDDNSLKYCEVEYSDWGIHTYGYPSSGNVVENCYVHDNDQGIRVEYSGFYIGDCEVHDNRHNVVVINDAQVDIEGTKIYDGGRDGIYSEGSNAVNLYGNVIEDNGSGGTSTRNGIYAGNNDVFNIGITGYYNTGKNTIRNNYSDEVYAQSTISGVQLFQNSVHDDDGYEVYNASGTTIYAQVNWWGDTPPNSAQFYGNVTYIDYWESEPGWEGQTSSGELGKTVAVSSGFGSPREKIDYLKNLISGEFQTARGDSAFTALFSMLRSDYVDNQYRERDDFYGYLSDLYRSHKDYAVGKRALQYMIVWKMLAGENKMAIELSQKALGCTDEPGRMGVMKNLVNLYTYTDQFDEAARILNQYREQYRKDEAGIEFLTVSLADKKEMYEQEKALGRETTPPEEPFSSLVSDKFQLYKAYPNPFNPRTAISFNLPEETRIEIVVYDLVGREIWKSAKTNYAAGSHSVIWNGTDRAGRPVGTGMYIVKLNSNKYSATQKVLLMK